MQTEATTRTPVKEIVTRDVVYQGCTVMRWDGVGIVFETQRNVTVGSDVETVVSQLFVPWTNIQHILLKEERV